MQIRIIPGATGRREAHEEAGRNLDGERARTRRARDDDEGNRESPWPAAAGHLARPP